MSNAGNDNDHATMKLDGESADDNDEGDDTFLMRLVAARARGVELEEEEEEETNCKGGERLLVNSIPSGSKDNNAFIREEDVDKIKNHTDNRKAAATKTRDPNPKFQHSALPAVGISLEEGNPSSNFQVPGAYAIEGVRADTFAEGNINGNNRVAYSTANSNGATYSLQEADEEVGEAGALPRSVEPSGAATDETNGFNLVEAHPAVPAEELAQAEPVEANSERQRIAKKQQRSRFTLLIATVALVGVVVVVLAVAIVVTNQQQGSPESTSSQKENAMFNSTAREGDSGKPSGSASDQALQGILQEFKDSLPDNTLESLKDPFSPQSQAYHWLFHDVPVLGEDVLDILELPLWRHRQLFALATYYYASDGSNWPVGINLDWLDLSHGRTECDWFSTNDGEFFPGGSFGETGNNLHAESCNPEGEFQSLHLTHGGLFGFSLQNAKMPSEISFLTSMKHIILGEAGITDTVLQDMLPTELFYELSNLETLLLFSDKVTGTIPTELGLLTQLKGLGRNYMSLSGTIPSELGLATQLQMIGFMANSNLTGAIPSELWALPNLTTIDFSNCNLSGELPDDDAIKQLMNFEYVNLYGNDLSGSIPRTWGTPNSLLHLNLAENPRLTGTIPENLCRLNDAGCFYVHAAWGTNSSCLLNLTCNELLCGCDCDVCAP